MEITPTKSLIVLVMLAMLGLAISYGWARVQVGDRFHAFNTAADNISYARGGNLPTAEEVRTQVSEFAMANQITLTGLHVDVHDEAGIGRIGDRAPQLGATLTGSQRIYEVTGSAEAQALFVTKTFPLTIRIALRNTVSVRGAERPLPAREDAENVRGLRR